MRLRGNELLGAVVVVVAVVVVAGLALGIALIDNASPRGVP